MQEFIIPINFIEIGSISQEKYMNMEFFSRFKHSLTVFLRTTTTQANGDISLKIKFSKGNHSAG